MQFFLAADVLMLSIAFLVCGSLALVVTVAIRLLRLTTKSFSLLFFSITTFALLGFVTRQIMGHSREPAVGAVLPAVLTLLGGVAIYLIGSKGLQTQAVVSSMVFCFAVALLAGSLSGSRLRVAFDAADPGYLLDHDLGIERNRHAVEVQQLLDYVELLKLKRDFTEKEKIDLSRFKSSLETAPPSK